MDKPETRIEQSSSAGFIRTILAIGTSLALLFLWTAIGNQDPEGQLISAALGTMGLAFFAPMWGAMRGRFPLSLALAAIALVLLGAMQFDVWAWRRASGPVSIHLSDFLFVLVPAVPGMVWLVRSIGQPNHND